MRFTTFQLIKYLTKHGYSDDDLGGKSNEDLLVLVNELRARATELKPLNY